MNNIILSKNYERPISNNKIVGNDNILVIGEQKDLLKANVLQMNSNYVIYDKDLDIFSSVGGILQNNGYQIRVINLKDFNLSHHYNLFTRIYEVDDMELIARWLLKNETNNKLAKEYYLIACISFLYEYQPDYLCLYSFLNYMCKKDFDLYLKQDANPVTKFYYESFVKLAKNDSAEIITQCKNYLIKTYNEEILNLFAFDEVFFYEKSAIFIVPSDKNDDSRFILKQLISWFSNLKRKYSVQFILPNFNEIGVIPGFVKSLFYAEEENLSFFISIDKIGDITKLYKKTWLKLLKNIPCIICYKTTDEETLDYIYTKYKIKDISSEHVMLIMSQHTPILDLSYDIQKHPKYKELIDCDKENLFNIKTFFFSKLNFIDKLKEVTSK